jgi:hypothetical protein
MAAGDLTSLQNACGWLGISTGTDDATINRLISAVSITIQKDIGYQIASASYTRTFNGRGSRSKVTPDRPITAVASVSIDGVAIPASTGPLVQGFTFDDRAIYLRGGYEFTRGVQNCTLAYTAGYSATPADLEQACLEWIKLSYASKKNPDRDASVKAIKAGDTSMAFAGSGSQSDPHLIAMPPTVWAVVQNYQRVAPV